MADYAVFQMTPAQRQALIEEHQFYVDQARKRLFSQFETIDADAYEAADAWLEKMGGRSHPDGDDADDFYNAAHEVAERFAGQLHEMRGQIRMAIVAGMFHLWEKNFRRWLIGQVSSVFGLGENLDKAIRNISIDDLVLIIKNNSENSAYIIFENEIYNISLIVNVYKHGSGESSSRLLIKTPSYIILNIENMFSNVKNVGSQYTLTSYLNIDISDEVFENLSCSFINFWNAIPENFWLSQWEKGPNWLEKAIAKDLAQNRKTGEAP